MSAPQSGSLTGVLCACSLASPQGQGAHTCSGLPQAHLAARAPLDVLAGDADGHTARGLYPPCLQNRHHNPGGPAGWKGQLVLSRVTSHSSCPSLLPTQAGRAQL